MFGSEPRGGARFPARLWDEDEVAPAPSLVKALAIGEVRMEQDDATREGSRRKASSLGYRVICADGVERTIGTGREWADAFKSGTVTGQSLVWDPQALRWKAFAELDLDFGAGGLSWSAATAPDLVSDDGLGGGAGVHDARSGAELDTRRAASSRTGAATRTILTAIVCALGLAGAWAALTGQAARLSAPAAAVLEGVPWPVYALIGLILAEEFLWFALRLLRVRGTGFARRLLVQALAMASTAVALYALSLPTRVLDLWVGLGDSIGLAVDPTVPGRIVAALSSGAARQAASLALVQQPVFTGTIFGAAALFWALVLLRKGAAVRRAAATLTATAMIIATLHMVLTPALKQPRPGGPPPPAGPAANPR